MRFSSDRVVQFGLGLIALECKDLDFFLLFGVLDLGGFELLFEFLLARTGLVRLRTV